MLRLVNNVFARLLGDQVGDLASRILQGRPAVTLRVKGVVEVDGPGPADAAVELSASVDLVATPDGPELRPTSSTWRILRVGPAPDAPPAAGLSLSPGKD
jgi:hypothetical protein